MAVKHRDTGSELLCLIQYPHFSYVFFINCICSAIKIFRLRRENPQGVFRVTQNHLSNYENRKCKMRKEGKEGN